MHCHTETHKTQQLGTDRVVCFTFGVGESASHLVLELYAGGNIILTDFKCVCMYVCAYTYICTCTYDPSLTTPNHRTPLVVNPCPPTSI